MRCLWACWSQNHFLPFLSHLLYVMHVKEHSSFATTWSVLVLWQCSTNLVSFGYLDYIAESYHYVISWCIFVFHHITECNRFGLTLCMLGTYQSLMQGYANHKQNIQAAAQFCGHVGSSTTIVLLRKCWSYTFMANSCVLWL